MTDTLRSIAEGMEHEGPHCYGPNGLDDGPCWFHGKARQLQTCHKCRLTALLSEYEKVDLVKKWQQFANIEQKGRELAHGIVSDWLKDDSGTEIEQRDKLVGNLAAAIQAVVDEEREECAKETESWSAFSDENTESLLLCESLTKHIAAAIRARAQAKEKP